MVNKMQIIIQTHPFLFEARAAVYSTRPLLSLSSVLSSQWCNNCRLCQTLRSKEDIKRHYILSVLLVQCKGKDSGGHGSGGLHPHARCQQPGAQPAGERW